ncbi:hypothetical protein Pcinc_010034 [Petrolisthes cinctipes]|uniref:Uncharacterized protein n=1 Tax=Petrolisthes cinctipes TaxID=88211 RepID=A0AAE1KUW3_PETCI|nr:hypothetical protein Pcinc_010034 [Petrolisthes cinctipes]
MYVLDREHEDPWSLLPYVDLGARTTDRRGGWIDLYTSALESWLTDLGNTPGCALWLTCEMLTELQRWGWGQEWTKRRCSRLLSSGECPLQPPALHVNAPTSLNIPFS